jgi:hypothetical protein
MNIAVQQRVLTNVNKALSTPTFQEYLAEIKNMVDACQKFTIKDEETLARATDMISQIRGLENRLEDARKEAIEESRSFTDAVNGKVREWRNPLKDAGQILSRKILDFRRVLEQKRREAEEKARKEAERLQAKLNKKAEKTGAPPVEVPAPVVPKTSNVTRGSVGKAAGRKTWKVRLTDIKALAKAVAEGEAPQELLQFNENFGNQLARASKGARKIPGVEFFEQESLSTWAA